MPLARILDHAGMALLLGGLAGYVILLAIGLVGRWYLPYPVSGLWLLVTGLPAAGVAIMFLRARENRIVFEDGDEE